MLRNLKTKFSTRSKFKIKINKLCIGDSFSRLQFKDTDNIIARLKGEDYEVGTRRFNPEKDI